MKLSNRGLSLLAMYMPLTTLTALVFLVKALMPDIIPSISLIASGSISALAASLYCEFMKNAKSGRAAANTRGGIIIMLVIYISISMLRLEFPWNELNERFMPNFSHVLACISALYVWISVVSLRQLLSIRERMEKTWNNYFAQLVIIGLLVIICAGFKIHLPLALYFLLIVILAGAVCIFGFFETIRWEHFYATEGISFSANDKAKRIFTIAVFSLLCIIAAILLSGDKSLFSFSLIIRFLTWLFALLNRISPSPGELNYPDHSFSMDLYQDMIPVEENPASSILQLISKYALTILKYSFFTLIAAVFIKFMISPLLNRGKVSDNVRGKLPFHRRLVRVFTEWLKEMLSAIVSFFAQLKNKKRLKHGKITAEEINKTAKTIFTAYSPEKKRDMQRSVTLFARLIIWGGKVRKVTWKPSHAPGEYCSILAGAVLATTSPAAAPDTSALQQQNEDIIRIGEIFEKALYSAEELSAEEREEFKALVEELTAS